MVAEFFLGARAEPDAGAEYVRHAWPDAPAPTALAGPASNASPVERFSLAALRGLLRGRRRWPLGGGGFFFGRHLVLA